MFHNKSSKKSSLLLLRPLSRLNKKSFFRVCHGLRSLMGSSVPLASALLSSPPCTWGWPGSPKIKWVAIFLLSSIWENFQQGLAMRLRFHICISWKTGLGYGGGCWRLWWRSLHLQPNSGGKNIPQIVDCLQNDLISKQFVVSGLIVDRYKNVCWRLQPHSFCRLPTWTQTTSQLMESILRMTSC